MGDKTYQYIFNNILSKVLQLSENPYQFAEYLTLQIRELIGARTIVIAVREESGPIGIFSVYPVRRTEWAKQSEVVRLAEISLEFETVQYLNYESGASEASGILQQLDIEKAIAVPLIAANRKVGSILLLDIMDSNGIDTVIDLLTQLSGVFALVIRNSSLYLNLENLVDIRTRELQEQNQELIEARLRAEESERLKSTFLANMSHEIRTPMNGILGFAELLKEPGLSGEEQQKYISIIEEGGVRLLNIINNLIDISKLESGLMQLSLTETNINTQLRYIYTFFQPEAGKKGLDLVLMNNLTEDEAVIETDREKVYAILTNLVKNAIKYSEVGAVEFGCRLTSNNGSNHHPNGSPGELEFFVKDTGWGIAEEKLNLIFERFIQADLAANKIRQGAGLGLAISKAYVEMLGGKIWVNSIAGKGSVFYFTLPVQPVKPI